MDWFFDDHEYTDQVERGGCCILSWTNTIYQNKSEATNIQHTSITKLSQYHDEMECEKTCQDEDVPEKAAFLYEVKDLTPVHKESGTRYTIAEDLQILNYVSIHPLSSAGSRKYWKQAVNDPSFPCRYRTVESLRDRYRYQLRFVDEEDKKKLEEWVEKHGNQGYSIFNTVPSGPGEKKGFHRKLVLMGLENQIAPKTSTHNVKEKKSSARPKENMIENSLLIPEDYICDLETAFCTGHFQIEEKLELCPEFSLPRSWELLNSNASMQTKDIEVDEFHYLFASPKRKEYNQMFDVDDFIMPYKAIKPNPDYNFMDIECESIWIEAKPNEVIGPFDDVYFESCGFVLVMYNEYRESKHQKSVMV